jgi:hypothetical protein
VGGQPDAENLFLAQLSVIRRDQGRHAELIEPLRKLADSLPHLPVWRVALAGLYCETDQLDEARAQIDMLASFDFRIPLSWTWPSTVINIAQVCDDLRDQKVASIYYPQLRPVSAQVGVTGLGLLCYGSLALPCGQFAACLQKWTEAEGYFQEAITMNERIGARPYLVRSRRAYASMLIDRNGPGDQVRATELVEAGYPEAEHFGMKREVERMERLRRSISAH